MLKERKWIIKEAADPAKAGALAAELGIDRVLAELLVKRGVETFEQARSFFRPSLDNLHDPFLMTDMDAAVERVRKAVTEGEKILARIRYSPDGRKLCCTAVRIYGEAECARVCADAIIDALGIPHEFSPEVLESARRINQAGVTAEDINGRVDLRGESIFTIDGADAKDLDDAITVKRVKSGFELSVHIADVSHYVRDGSPLDVEALNRGTSVYFADRVIPMYPEDISNGICSLNARPTTTSWPWSTDIP